MNIAIDIGWTIKGVRNEGDKDKIASDSFRVISNFIKRGDEVFIISRVNSEQKERAEKLLKDIDFFNVTGVNPNNLYFCFNRKDKAIFFKALDINIVIDDRAEVMVNISPLVLKLLLNPEKDDLIKHEKKLLNCKIVQNWLDIERTLF